MSLVWGTALVGRVLRLDLLATNARDGVVRGDRRLAHADRDQRDLAFVARDVAGGVNARERRLAGGRIDQDLPLAVQLEAPVGDRAEVGVETEQRDQRLAWDLLDLAGLRVLDRDRLQRAVAVELAHLAGREEPHAAFARERARLVDRRLERAEVVATV